MQHIQILLWKMQYIQLSLCCQIMHVYHHAKLHDIDKDQLYYQKNNKIPKSIQN